MMNAAMREYPNELTAAEFGHHISAACQVVGTSERPNRFAILVIQLERSDRGSALANLADGIDATQEIRLRVSEAIRTIDQFTMAGLNEVVLFLPGIDSQTIINLAGKKLFKALNEPLKVHGKTVILHPAIGCSFFPDHGASPEALIGSADEACFEARKLPDPKIDFYSNTRRTEYTHQLVEELRVAIDRNELEVWLQPQIDCRRLDYGAAEALIRWPRPVGKKPVHAGLIAEIAESHGLMKKMTEFVVGATLRHMKRLEEHGILLDIGINLSASVLCDPDLPNRIKRDLLIYHVPAHRLTLEVTESSLMKDYQGALKVMRDLKKLGARLSIDDFGTGYSSLSYLRQMPLDELKIDQVFVRNILDIESDRQITKSVIDLSHTFGFEAVAEGVESRAVMDLLIGEYGCDILQGYYFSKPIPIQELIAWWPTRRAFLNAPAVAS
jgi:EAL domain-containing protein (putative c-di-GMP-specific phosphodiesterase class I)